MKDGKAPSTKPVPTIQADVVRDRDGNWEAVSRTFSAPVADATPFPERWLMGVHSVAKEKFPVLAHVLADRVDAQLVPAVERAREVEAKELRFLADRQRSVTASNEAFEAELKAAKADHLIAAKPLTEAKLYAESAVAEALMAAAEAIGNAGYSFAPKDADLGLNPPTAPTGAYVAGREGIASPAFDRARGLPVWLEVPLTGVLGGLVGVSVLGVQGFVHLSSLDRDKPLNVVLAAAVGMASVTLGGYAAKYAASNAAQAAGLGRKSAWMFAGVLGYVAVLGGIHAVADYQGISQSGGLRALMSGHPKSSDLATAVMSLTFGLPYLAYSLLSGLRTGRANATEPRIEYLRQLDLEERNEAWRTPETLAALAAIGKYRALEAESDRISESCEAMAANHAAEIVEIEGRVVELPSEMSARAKDRIDRARGDAEECQREVDRALAHVSWAMGESGFCWPWLYWGRSKKSPARRWAFWARDRSGWRAF